MTIKWKILVTVCIPVAGLLVFLGTNSMQLRSITKSVDNTVTGVMIPIVDEDIPSINKSNASISLLLNGDRDAYQAYVAQVESMGTNDIELLKKLDSDNLENINQVEQRVAQSSADFDGAMNNVYGKFKENFVTWKANSREALKTSVKLADDYAKRKSLMAASIKDFDVMRDCIDRIEQLLEDKIKVLVGQEGSSAKEINSLYESYTLLLNADRDAYQAYLAQMQAIGCKDVEEMKKILDDNSSNIAQVADRAAKASAVFDDDMNKIYDEFNSYYAKWQSGSESVVQISSNSIDMSLARLDYHKKALSAFDTFRGTINTLSEMLDAKINKQVENIGIVSEEAHAETNRMIGSISRNAKISLVAGVSIALVSIVISLYICGVIIRVLSEAISSMTQSSEQVASAASQVSSTSMSLAEGSCEQASGIEQITSSMDEIASQTNANAENAKLAHKFALEVNASTIKGNDAMGQMSSAIGDIQKSSEETSKIVKTIDEIAFQTNLLALNAAVEAARAGEAGKGFAVVAEEVRNLAMRSAEAARSTTAMIEESVKNANNGVEIVTKVGDVLNEIATSVEQTTDYVSNISTSNDEQAAAIGQIKCAIAQMDKITQSNASSSEEGASAAEELTAQAETMNDIVHNLAVMVGTAQGKIKMVKNKVFDLPSVRQAKKLSNADKAFHEIANGDSGTAAPVSKETPKYNTSTKEHAEAAIPFGDDGFDEFN